jgi:ankyrin repeat protein
MKTTIIGITMLFTLVCFGFTEERAFDANSSKHEVEPLRADQVNQSQTSAKPDNYCPDKSEAGTICGTIELRAGGCNPLMVAAEAGDLNAVRDGLARHTDVNAKGPGGHSALTLAAGAGHLDVVKALLNAGANPNTILGEFHFGPVPALAAAMNRCNDDWLQIMDAMIAAGAEVNPAGGLGQPPLIYAVEKHDRVFIQALLARGAKVNLKNPLGMTALMTETISSAPSAEVVKLLLGAGADARARNNQGETALTLLNKHATARAEKKTIARLLKQAGP